MIITDIVKLTIPCEEWIFTGPNSAKKFAEELVAELYKAGGMGLAANQIGVLTRVFAFPGPKEDYVCFNPNIEAYSDEVIEMEEGCLSFPNLLFDIKRAKHVTLSFYDYKNNRLEQDFTGMTARIIQHEMEHLDGELFFQGMSRLKIERAIKEAKKRGTDYSGMGLLRFAKKET